MRALCTALRRHPHCSLWVPGRHAQHIDTPRQVVSQVDTVDALDTMSLHVYFLSMTSRTDVSGNQSIRRAGILEAATGVFVRFGFKKTSMDDVARAAGLSRQGLYLHFPNKADLFRAVVTHFTELTRVERRKVLAQKDVELEARLLEAFVVTHGTVVGSEHLRELVASAAQLVSDVYQSTEQHLAADVARALKEHAVAAHWKHAGVSATELADLLAAASVGIKHDAKSPAEYRRRMSVAVRVICRTLAG